MKIFELKHPEYVPVRKKGVTFFGGSQTWMSLDHRFSKDYVFHKWGCGGIAVADLILYLARSERECETPVTSLARTVRPVMDIEDYTTYLNFLRDHVIQIVPWSGMTGFAVAKTVNYYAARYAVPIKASWKLFYDDDKMLQTIRHMIKENIPVILAIGPNTPIIFGKKGVTFYLKSKKEDNSKLEHYQIGAKNVNRHYVTVTGIVGLKNKQTLLKISSWGTEYYIDYEELRNYINHTGDRLTSSMLYVERKDKQKDKTK